MDIKTDIFNGVVNSPAASGTEPPAETAANGIHLAPAKPVTIGNNTAGAAVEEHSGHEIIEAVDPGAA